MVLGGTIVALVVVGVVPMFASARHHSVPDPNDVKGSMDVRRIEVGGTGKRPKWRVVTYGRWSAASIWDEGFAFLHLDTLGKPRPDYYVQVRSDGFGMEATLWRDRGQKNNQRIARLRIRRVDRRSFTVTVPLKKMKMPPARLDYHWFAKTIWTNTDDCPRACFDRIPDTGTVTEPIPGRSRPPSPTIVPTSTPVP